MAEKGWTPGPIPDSLCNLGPLMPSQILNRDCVLPWFCPGLFLSQTVLMVLTLILTQFLVPTSLSTLDLRLQVDANPVYPHSLKLNMCSQILQLLSPILSFSP